LAAFEAKLLAGMKKRREAPICLLEPVPMTSQSLVQARVDKNVKDKAARTLAEMGLSVSDAIRLLLARVAVEKKLPFDAKIPNAETKAAMAEIERGGAKPFASVAELMTDLNADD
jgi:DNA-damage-inducible protein J